MSRSPRATPSFTPEQSYRAGFHVAVSVLALLAIVAMVNYLAARHFRRYQWSADQRYALSPETLRVLHAVTNDLRVVVLFNRNDELFGPVTGLLREYTYACPHLRVETVDYNRDPGRAELLAAHYLLPDKMDNVVVFDAGGRVKVVRASELSDYDLQALLAGKKEVRRLTFKGEPLFTSAIAGLLQERLPVACFLEDHGEHDPDSDDELAGYSRFATLLRNKNVDVRKIGLAGEKRIPKDCALLVIAGPRSRLAEAELEKIDRYLASGGRVLALLSFYQAHRTELGLERLLFKWGVAVGNNYVFDPPNSLRGNDLVCTNFSAHPIVKPLWGKSIYLVFARSVTPRTVPGARGDAPRVQPLAFTSEHGYTASALGSDGTPQPDPRRDRKGAIPFAVAVEKGSLAGVSADRFSTRMVVVGESFFLGNETIVKAANWEFASLAVNWLLDRPEHLSGIAPRPIKEYEIALTRTRMTQLMWILLGLLPGAVLGWGLLVWMRRRA